MRRFTTALLIAAGVLLVTRLAPAFGDSSPLSAEANVRVTMDLDMPHTESAVAVNPRNANDVVGATTVFADLSSTLVDKTYTSRDGGATWADTTPEAARNGQTGDPRVLFTDSGAALFFTLNLGSHRTDVYRSTDGGVTWSGHSSFKLIDHEEVAVDRSSGRYHNRIYLAAEGGVPDKHAPPSIGGDRKLWIFTSDDDGRTFQLHSTAEDGVIGAGQRFNYGGVGATGLAVLSDGTVVLGFARYSPSVSYEAMYVATSHDGGRTFGRAVQVGTLNMFTSGNAAMLARRMAEEHAGDVSAQGEFFSLAAAPGGAAYANRVYAAWPDAPLEHGPVMFSYSSDRGRTWSTPRRLAPSQAAAQFMPELAVNPAGAIVATWFSTAGFANNAHFNLYAALSNDGGRSFSSPLRVTSAPSTPRTPGNLRPISFYYKELGYGFISAYSRWGAGGDYDGLAAGPDGVFHAYWPDSRGAEYQIYSARIHASPPLVAPASAAMHDVTNDVVLDFDPITIDVATGEVDIPIRLRNVSHETLYPQITATFQGLQSAVMQHSMHMTAPAVTILNAPNGKTADGAAFDYSNALGTYGALPPGSVTEPVVWRFRVSDIENLSPISLHLRISART